MPEHPSHRHTRHAESWGPLTCAVLGVWLIAGPTVFEDQSRLAAWSDVTAGALTLLLSAIALRRPRLAWPPWIICLTGIWLLHAPLVFHTVSAAVYLNDTLIGVGLIAFSVILPRRRWEKHDAHPDIPAGWTFNPSSWFQRAPIIALAWMNFLLARYLTAYQLDHISAAWDPVFGDGTQRVLDSHISEAFPVSDAGLGAAAYIIEALIGYMGAANRWRTAPWTVALFGVLVIPVGVISTILMILQPVAVGAWCAICILTAALMIVMACLALPEVVAMMQYLARCRRDGRNVWRTFWLGGDDAGGDVEQPPASTAAPLAIARAMVCGTTMPWPLALSALIGVWFVAASDVLGMQDRAMDAHVIAGALVIVISILALSEVLRAARWANIIVGLTLAALVWLLEGATLTGQITTTVAGVALALLTPPRGPVRQRYATWDRCIR